MITLWIFCSLVALGWMLEEGEIQKVVGESGNFWTCLIVALTLWPVLLGSILYSKFGKGKSK